MENEEKMREMRKNIKGAKIILELIAALMYGISKKIGSNVIPLEAYVIMIAIVILLLCASMTIDESVGDIKVLCFDVMECAVCFALEMLLIP